MIESVKRRNLVGAAARVREGEYAVEVRARVDGKWVALGEVQIPLGVIRIKVAAVRVKEER
jgi:hypothetical protein